MQRKKRKRTKKTAKYHQLETNLSWTSAAEWKIIQALSGNHWSFVVCNFKRIFQRYESENSLYFVDSCIMKCNCLSMVISANKEGKKYLSNSFMSSTISSPSGRRHIVDLWIFTANESNDWEKKLILSFEVCDFWFNLCPKYHQSSGSVYQYNFSCADSLRLLLVILEWAHCEKGPRCIQKCESIENNGWN